MSSSQTTNKRPFLAAKPSPLLIMAAQSLIRAQLSIDNRLRIDRGDVNRLAGIPAGSGLILASNHADEMDPRVCLELSRQSRKRFILMCNREAFDEVYGVAGKALQGLGYFSVERGAHDAEAKNYAVDVVRQGKDVLVIFPEGEIFYLNESLQHFHSGAVEIGMQAIIDQRRANPNWTAYIVPMAIKYHYDKPIDDVLSIRIKRMEEHLAIKKTEESFSGRLRAIQATLLNREKLKYNVQFASEGQGLTDEVVRTRREILSEVEARHGESHSEHRRAIDEAWKLGAELRDSVDKQAATEQREALEKDIEALNEVAQLASWLPSYYRDTTSNDRLAEAVIKLERELFKIKRPPQLASRTVHVRVAEPIDLGPFLDEYLKNAQTVRLDVTNNLQTLIQSLVDEMITKS